VRHGTSRCRSSSSATPERSLRRKPAAPIRIGSPASIERGALGGGSRAD
jgi:hypothetical protein